MLVCFPRYFMVVTNVHPVAEEECRETYVKHIASRMPRSEDLPTYERATRVGDKRGLQLLNHISDVPGARVTVRALCLRAIDTLQHYSPCLLMTPSSVADYLPKSTEFDLVIIDEASQMLPEEAHWKHLAQQTSRSGW
jgi:hypothetical protein